MDSKPRRQRQQPKADINEYVGRRNMLRLLGFKDYETYLQSDLWRSIRRRVLERDRWVCRVCGLRATTVHHTSYSEPVLRGEADSLWKLVSLCNPCHHTIEYQYGRKVQPRDTIGRMALLRKEMNADKSY